MVGHEIETKQLELLKEAVPRISRVAMLYTRAWLEGRPPATVFKSLAAAADVLKVQLVTFPVDKPEQFPDAFAALAGQRVDGLLVQLTGFNVARCAARARRGG